MRTAKQAASALAVMAALTGLAGCGSGTEQSTGTVSIMRSVAAPVLSKLPGRAPAKGPAKAPDVEGMAARALAANPNPLILAGIEAFGGVQVMALNGSNDTMRTYMTPSMQALILRNGLLVGTRGLGHDLSVAELNQVAPLILGRRAGEGTRTMRYLTGDAVERPLTVACKVAVGERKSVPFAGRSWSGATVAESCKGGGVRFTNTYLVGDNGTALVSQQWIGPGMGSVTIQTIRE